MSAHQTVVRGSITEEVFADPSEAQARKAALERDSGAESVTLTTSRNYNWMDPDSIWYIVRWNKTRGVTDG